MSAIFTLGRKFMLADTPSGQNVDLAALATFTSQLNSSTDLRLSSTSSTPVSDGYADEITLSAGTYTIDLTACAGPFSVSKTFSGLKVQWIAFFALTTNSAAIVITKGGSNPYNIFGDTNGSVTLGPGMSVRYGCEGAEYLADVSGTVKNILVTSGMAAAKFQMLVACG